MKQYRLIKEYPGSPSLEQIALPYTNYKNEVVHYVVERNQKKDCDFIALKIDWIENQPEYWEEVKDNIWYMVLLRDGAFRNSWEVIRVEACLIDAEDRKYFKTKEEAEDFILYNKPCLSINDICENVSECFLNKLKRIVKSKL